MWGDLNILGKSQKSQKSQMPSKSYKSAQTKITKIINISKINKIQQKQKSELHLMNLFGMFYQNSKRSWLTLPGTGGSNALNDIAAFVEKCRMPFTKLVFLSFREVGDASATPI
jgi:hypothetical protein